MMKIILLIIFIVFFIILFYKNKTKIYFVTLVDKDSVYKCENLKKTLNNNLIIVDTYDNSVGNFSKIFQFREFLQNSKNIRDKDVICFMDAFDVLCLKYDPQGILNAFKSYNKKLVIGCEENCGPEHTKKCVEYFRNNYKPGYYSYNGSSDVHYIEGFYLNGGFQIGYKSEFIKLHDYIHDHFDELKNNLEINRNTEQGIISQVFITEKFDMGLDTNFILVNNCGPEAKLRTYIDTFFIHIIRADTNAKKFIMTDELREHYSKFEKGLIKYDKHIDMITRHKTFEEQTERYKKILKELEL